MNEARLPQGTIRYREHGSGAPIVLVHGLLANGELWRDVVPLLAEEFRVIVPELPLGSHELPLGPSADLIAARAGTAHRRLPRRARARGT